MFLKRDRLHHSCEKQTGKAGDVGESEHNCEEAAGFISWDWTHPADQIHRTWSWFTWHCNPFTLILHYDIQNWFMDRKLG